MGCAPEQAKEKMCLGLNSEPQPLKPHRFPGDCPSLHLSAGCQRSWV